MGLFRRSRPAAEPTGSAPTPDTAPVAREPQLAAWETAAPLTPTLTPPSPTFKIGAAVKEDLVALTSPRLTRGMGHLVGGDGPAGVVSGLATIGVQRRADDLATPGHSDTATGPAAPTLTLARRAEGDDTGPPPAETAPGPSWPDTVLVPRIVSDGAPHPAAAPRPVEAPAVEPPGRHLPLVSPVPVQRRSDAVAPSVPQPPAPEAPTATADDPASLPPLTPEGDADTAPPEAAPLDLPADHPAPGTAMPGPPEPAQDAQATRDLTPPALPPHPRPGALGPPIDLPTLGSTHALPLVQRAVDAPASTTTVGTTAAGSGGSAPVKPPIRQRPRGAPAGTDAAQSTRPTVARRLDTDAGALHGGSPSPAAAGPTAPGPVDPAPVVPSLPLVMRTAESDSPPGPPPLVTRTADTSADTAPTLGPPGEETPPPGDTPTTADGPVADPTPEHEAAATVRPTLGLDDTATHAGPAGSMSSLDASGGVDPGPTHAHLPLPTIQRRALDSVTDPFTAAGGPGHAHPGHSRPGPPLSDGQAAPPPLGTTLPLVAQRSLAPAPSLASALATRAGNDPRPAASAPAHAPAAAPVPTWPLATGPSAAPAMVQRWPDLGALGGAGRSAVDDVIGSGRDRAEALASRARDTAADRLGGAVPELPSTPTLPALDLANAPALPEVPSMPPGLPGVPSIPGLPSVPSMPLVPGVPAMPTTPSIPAMSSLPGIGGPGAGGVPMTEITFPAGASAGSGGTVAASAQPPAGDAGSGAGGGGAAGGDLDELAHKLYDRIRWRLRSELRLDRERAGLGAGVRH